MLKLCHPMILNILIFYMTYLIYNALSKAEPQREDDKECVFLVKIIAVS